MGKNKQAFIQGFIYLTRLDFIAAELIRANSPVELVCGMQTAGAQKDQSTNTGPWCPQQQ